MTSPTNSAEHAARRAKNSKALRTLARVGYVASGILHLIIGWLAVRLAFGDSGGGSADQSGALRQLADAPGGAFLLWAAAVGLAALALWHLVEAAVGVPGSDTAKQTGARLKAAGKGILYGFLAVLAARIATGGGGGGGNTQEDLTAKVLKAPGGELLIGAVGLAIVAVGVFHVYKGWTKKFREDLVTTGPGAVGDAVVRLGQVGYIAKGVALGVLGVLFVVAAVTHDADKAGGFDDALKAIRDQPFGVVLLVVVGLGIAAYGLYSFARARYAKL
ncbi:uncharacterized protein DUF1206 [Isoptericola jiangsuensis]|uniref:Uncharacterized protein DUF1206 n=1 Tax=Isoptericola jiangsuensis TaxID=548579 RepID=A0A2A9ESK2_9MICO|nr:DUF1206 domain-containing protein [Isoptericola jiangsuensis]PFG41858.1 uncharacterized protein DUF1206 [Isoptericola jiangsuensis]